MDNDAGCLFIKVDIQKVAGEGEEKSAICYCYDLFFSVSECTDQQLLFAISDNVARCAAAAKPDRLLVPCCCCCCCCCPMRLCDADNVRVVR